MYGMMIIVIMFDIGLMGKKKFKASLLVAKAKLLMKEKSKEERRPEMESLILAMVIDMKENL